MVCIEPGSNPLVLGVASYSTWNSPGTRRPGLFLLHGGTKEPPGGGRAPRGFGSNSH